MKRTFSSTSCSGFSLIEIALALGIVSFAFMTIVSLLPQGLATVHDSSVQSAVATISQQLRGEFEQLPFTTTPGSNYSIAQVANLGPYYYTRDGVKTTMGSTSAPVYYTANFASGQPSGVLNGDSFAGPTSPSVTLPMGETMATSSAQYITVTLTYPTSSTGIQFALLIAKQMSN